MIKWPWSTAAPTGTLVLGGMPERLLWVHAAAPLGQLGPLLRCGVIEHAVGDTERAARALQELRLPLKNAVAVLPLQQSQWLQIEAPAVPADELRAAARWRIKELVNGRVDDLTLDVMQVGDGRTRATQHLFVAAARRALVEDLGRVTLEAGLALSVVDVAEAAQRNLVAAHATAAGLATRAVAGLFRHGRRCLLTISVGAELFYARRLDIDNLDQRAAPATAAAAPLDAGMSLEGVDFVDYGAEPDHLALEGGTPQLVIELQRSFDVWERTWTDLPLAGLVLALGADTAATAAAVEAATGVRVARLQPERLFPGFDDAPTALQDDLLPLLGALLREETKQP